ncbi:MAG: hypothetical protein A3F72_02930 [Bacteroidetes bacterium RIFCSPLOWO2_12_FULL_35_15]|nr:MAG: hypothetical protein A3F72_02930 [Bacteroidetes bacterium RIFCSPLOWO2_12_FULL_35_15]
MSNQTKITIIGWAGFAIMLVLFLQRCGTGNCPEVKNTSDTISITTYDTIPKNIPVPKPFPVPGATVIVELPAHVDTAAILQKYFNINYYKQVIADTNLRAVICDSVSQNSIINRTFTYQWLKPITSTTIINKPVEVPKKRMALYPGIFAGANTIGNNAGCGVSILLQTKKNTLYDVRYDLIQKRIELGAYFKLKFKK